MKPILFNTEMVKALLDGRKTTTRRVIKPQPDRYFEVHEFPVFLYDVEFEKGIINPPYQPGDILYVRETWQLLPSGFDEIPPEKNYIYRASNELSSECSKWRPSIFMPKEAARIFLRVIDVKAERLQEIDKHWDNYDREGMRDPKTENISIAMQEKFISIWDSTVKKSDRDKYGWDANPWVWVISFERCEKP